MRFCAYTPIRIPGRTGMLYAIRGARRGVRTLVRYRCGYVLNLRYTLGGGPGRRLGGVRHVILARVCYNLHVAMCRWLGILSSVFVAVLCVALGPELECSVGVRELTSSISYARCLLLGYVRSVLRLLMLRKPNAFVVTRFVSGGPLLLRGAKWLRRER